VVDVQCAGFFPLTDRTVTMTAGSAGSDGATEVIFTLEPIREYSETTNVQARSDALVLERNGAEKTIGSQELLNVPYPGSENVKNSLRILPGVVQDAFTGIHLNGAPEHEVLFLLDGFNIGDPLTGRYNPRISVDAVRAINVMSGPISAEFGKGSAGAIEIVTNTGDDRLRYSAATFVPVIGDIGNRENSILAKRIAKRSPFARRTKPSEVGAIQPVCRCISPRETENRQTCRFRGVLATRLSGLEIRFVRRPVPDAITRGSRSPSTAIREQSCGVTRRIRHECAHSIGPRGDRGRE